MRFIKKETREQAPPASPRKAKRNPKTSVTSVTSVTAFLCMWLIVLVLLCFLSACSGFDINAFSVTFGHGTEPENRRHQRHFSTSQNETLKQASPASPRESAKIADCTFFEQKVTVTLVLSYARTRAYTRMGGRAHGTVWKRHPSPDQLKPFIFGTWSR